MNESNSVDLVDGEALAELMTAAVTLLADGEPVEVARLAEAAGWPVTAMQPVLARFPRLDWDERGRVAGLGLTLRPTPHRFVVNGHPLFTWCAMDTLLFPLILGRAAQVASACPATRRPVSLTVGPDGVSALTPATAVVSEVAAARPGADIRTRVCDHGHFFASAAAAGSWLTEHPGGGVRPVAEAFEAAREWHTRRGWADGKLPC
jgi:alkylmercury lyase